MRHEYCIKRLPASLWTLGTVMSHFKDILTSSGHATTQSVATEQAHWKARSGFPICIN